VSRVRLWCRARARATVIAAACVVLNAPNGVAQRPGSGIEFRLDGVAGGSRPENALHAGAGAIWRLSTYARAAVVVGAGPSDDGAGARAEGVVRFHTDPLRERHVGLYGIAGVGAVLSSATEPYLTLMVGFEGARRRRWARAVEIGIARGFRIALIARRVRGDVR
jgi:hypothetical protein